MKIIQVKDVYQLHGTASDTVFEDSSLEEIVRIFATKPALRCIFLINSSQRFAGIITPNDLLKWSTIMLLKGKVEIKSAEEAERIVFATKAMDLKADYWPSLGVKETDNLQTALNQMIGSGENILPVIDNQGKILGDLRLSEILLKAFEVGKRET